MHADNETRSLKKNEDHYFQADILKIKQIQKMNLSTL